MSVPVNLDDRGVPRNGASPVSNYLGHRHIGARAGNHGGIPGVCNAPLSDPCETNQAGARQWVLLLVSPPRSGKRDSRRMPDRRSSQVRACRSALARVTVALASAARDDTAACGGRPEACTASGSSVQPATIGSGTRACRRCATSM